MVLRVTLVYSLAQSHSFQWKAVNPWGFSVFDLFYRPDSNFRNETFFKYRSQRTSLTSDIYLILNSHFIFNSYRWQSTIHFNGSLWILQKCAYFFFAYFQLHLNSRFITFTKYTLDRTSCIRTFTCFRIHSFFIMSELFFFLFLKQVIDVKIYPKIQWQSLGSEITPGPHQD